MRVAGKDAHTLFARDYRHHRTPGHGSPRLPFLNGGSVRPRGAAGAARVQWRFLFPRAPVAGTRAPSAALSAGAATLAATRASAASKNPQEKRKN